LVVREPEPPLPPVLAPYRVKPPQSREEILLPLSERERYCVAAMVASLERLAEETLPHAVLPHPGALPLLRAFRDVTGVEYVGCAWDD
jgi:hypothetical protein